MSTNLTDNDRKVLAAAWYCFESPPKVNYTKLAERVGYKNAATAAACFRPIKKKVLANAGEGSPAPTPKKARASKGGKGKGKRTAEEAEVDDGGDDDEEALDSKTKKAKKNVEEDGEVDGKVKDEGEVSES